MTKTMKFYLLVLSLFCAATIFASTTRADVMIEPECLPGQNPETSYCTPINNNRNNNQNQSGPEKDIFADQIKYIGVGVLAVVAISIAVLIKIKQKNVK